MKITLKAARTNAGLTQKELGKLINRSETTIVSWETGKTIPRMTDFDELCRVLNVNKNDLVLPSNQV